MQRSSRTDRSPSSSLIHFRQESSRIREVRSSRAYLETNLSQRDQAQARRERSPSYRTQWRRDREFSHRAERTQWRRDREPSHRVERTQWRRDRESSHRAERTQWHRDRSPLYRSEAERVPSSHSRSYNRYGHYRERQLPHSSHFTSLTVPNVSQDDDGLAHLAWLTNLNRQSKTVSPSQIIEYIEPLSLCLATISNWNIETIIHFYNKMDNMFFFSQKISNTCCKEKLTALYNELIKQITNKLEQHPIEAKNVSIKINLMRGISNSIFIQKTNESRRLCISLANKLINQFLIYDKRLNPSNVNNIMHCLISLFAIRELKESINALAEKYLCKLAQSSPSEQSNKNLSKFLLLVMRIKRETMFIGDSVYRDLIELTKKIDFSSNITGASIGLSTISTLLGDPRYIPNEIISCKIDECIFCIENHKYNLDSVTSFSVANAISNLAKVPNKISDVQEEILKICLDNMSSNINKFTSRELVWLFEIISNPYFTNIPRCDMFNVAVQVMSNLKETLLKLSNEHLHSLICSFSDAIKFTNYTETGNSFLRNHGILNKIIEKYLNYISNANFNTRIHAFFALSHISVKSIPPDQKTINILNQLCKSIENKLDKTKLTNSINFLHSTSILGELIDLDVEQYSELYISTVNKVISSDFKSPRKLSLLWSLLVFFVLHNDKLNENKKTHLKHTMHSLYKSIDVSTVEKDKGTALVMTEAWLGLQRSDFVQKAPTFSKAQNVAYRKLERKFGYLGVKNEYRINKLPPCDVAIPSQNIAIEIQGPHHCFDKERKIKTGSTALKLALLKAEGYRVIEVSVDEDGVFEKSMEDCIAKIEALLIAPKIKF